MAFEGRPQIDQSAINSRESEVALQAIFQEKYGFTCRQDIPDKGCDFVIELIEDEGWTNWRFQVQLKSIDKPKLVQKGTYIAYTIETSRLGYLLRSKPTTGIIVFYSVAEKKLYYDFIEKIYYRVKDSHKSEAWKKKNDVKIHIPVANELTNETAQHIYEKIKEWSKNLDTILEAVGENYSLPAVNIGAQPGFDIKNGDGVIEKLKKYGLQLLEEYELSVVRAMLDLVPYATILNDVNLAMLSAIAYCEAGLYVDSEYFVQKLKRNPALNHDQKTSLAWIELRNDYNTGKIDTSKFISRAEIQLPEVNYEINKLTLEVSITFFKLAPLGIFDEIPAFAIEQIQAVYERIEKLDEASETQKDQFRIFNSENYAIWLSAKKMRLNRDCALAKTLMSPHVYKDLVEQDTQIKIHFSILYTKIGELFKKALAEGKKMLLAHSIAVKNKLLLAFELDNIAGYPEPFRLYPNDLHTHKRLINDAIHAYNIFIEAGYTKQAHDMLCHALEFLFLSIHFYRHSGDHGYKIEELQEKKLKIEDDLQLMPYQLQVELLIGKVDDNTPNKANVKRLTDEQTEHLAKKAQLDWNLTDDHYPNILKEIKDIQIFNERSAGSDIGLEKRTPFRNNRQLLYSVHPRWRLINKKTSIVSADSSDIDALLTSWGI